MHVIASREALLSLIKAASIVAKAGEIRPIFRNTLITALGSSLEVAATDTSINLRLKLTTGNDLSIVKDGNVLVSAVNIQRVLDNVTSDRVTLTTDDLKLIITADSSKFELVTEDPRDFPKINRITTAVPFVGIQAQQIKALINRVAFCAHKERSLFNMHGVLVRIRDNKLTFVGTNGQRLGIGSVSVNTQVDNELVVPADNLPTLLKVTDSLEETETIEIQWAERSLNARGNRGEISLMALQGGYPPFEIGIPNNSKKLYLDRLNFIKLLKQSLALRGNSSPFIELTISSGKINLNTSVRDAGRSNIESTVDWKDEEISLYLNPEFLLDTCKTMIGKEIVLELEGPMDQPMLRDTSNDGIESFCVYSVVRQI